MSAASSGRPDALARFGTLVFGDEKGQAPEILERRVRAFSEFSAEPPVSPKAIDINSLLEERIAMMEGAEACRAQASGMAAIHLALMGHKGALTDAAYHVGATVAPRPTWSFPGSRTCWGRSGRPVRESG